MSKPSLSEQIKQIFDEPEELSWRIYNKVADEVLGLLDAREKKLRELADLLRKPLPISREYAIEPHEHLKIVERNLQNLNDQFDKLRNKFAELGLDTKKETRQENEV